MISETTRRRVERAERLSLDHGGVLSRGQLRSLGIERGVTARLVRDRRWAAWGRHSVVTHCAEVELVGACWRAVHEVGGGALVDGVSALRAAGVSGLDGSVVHVSVHSLQRSPSVDGVAVHKVSRRVEGEAAGAGLPRTRPAIAALRAAQWAVSDRQAALYLAVPVQQRLVTGAQLEAALDKYPGRRRRAFVATIVADLVDGAHSLGELDFAALCRRRRLPEPERQVVVTGSGGRCYLDVRWREGLVVEVDGRQHLEGLAPVQDMLRQNSVSMSGDVVLRIPLLGMRLEPDAFVDQVEAALALLRGRAPR